jgi:aryl-alcohol dehydrogenase-like predicted oxidoreductase
VITGATRTSQVRDNVAAAGLELDEEVVSRLDALFAAE